MRSSSLFFAFSTKVYDLITVGPHANLVARQVARLSLASPSILAIEQSNFCIEPSSLPYQGAQIPLRQRIPSFGDLEQGVGIIEISPNSNEIVLANEAKYRYKNLVYSGEVSDWKDASSYPGLEQALSMEDSFVYGDGDYRNLDRLLERTLGTVVFVLPRGRNFASENFLMLLLQAKMRRKVQNKYPGEQPGRVILLNEGSTLIEHNSAHNSLLEEMLKQMNIEHLKNQKCEFDYANKKIYGTDQAIAFDAVFHYLPLRVPEVLPIDPFQSNRHTLNHSLFDNIYCLGHVFPTTYSIEAIKHMSRVMAINIANKIIGARKQVLYQGDSVTHLWVNEYESMRIETNYDSLNLKSVQGTNLISRAALGATRRLEQRTSNERIINQGANAWQVFGRYEEINTARNVMPTLLHKTPSF